MLEYGDVKRFSRPRFAFCQIIGIVDRWSCCKNFINSLSLRDWINDGKVILSFLYILFMQLKLLLSFSIPVDNAEKNLVSISFFIIGVNSVKKSFGALYFGCRPITLCRMYLLVHSGLTQDDGSHMLSMMWKSQFVGSAKLSIVCGVILLFKRCKLALISNSLNFSPSFRICSFVQL